MAPLTRAPAGRGRVRRLTILGLLGLIGLAVAAFHPADASPAVDRQAWTRSSTVPTFPSQAGRIYVAADGGIESARAFVQPDATAVALTVAEVADTGTIDNSAAVQACPLTSPLTATGELTADAAPTADCSQPVAGVRHDDGTWSIPLDQHLAFGLALVPVLAPGATFHVAFDADKTAVVLPAAPVSPDASIAAPAPEPAAAPSPPVEDPAAVVAVPASLSSPAAVEAVAPPTAGPSVAAVAVDAAAPTVAPPRTALVNPLRNAATPPALAVLGLVGLLSAGGSVVAGRTRRRPSAPAAVLPRKALAPSIGGAALVLLPLAFGEVTVYRIGLVLILIVGAIGLHLLVNWAGELSLAHATLVGLPAFAVAKLSADHHLSPLLLLPLGVAVGLAAGAVIGLPAIRARGLQVALVTLAAGVAIDRFFFTKTWMVGGPSGAQVSTPRLGPLTFGTARSLYPLLSLIFIATVASAWMIYRSKVGRALLWVKAQPDAAAAFGIPVSRYRALAYALAGGYAGLAGGLTAVWVQRLTPDSFPLTKSFTYLIIVALAGRGFVGGVAAAAGFIEGGRLFISSGAAFITYAAPIGLILTLTQHRAGLNGLGRQIAGRLRPSSPEGSITMERVVVRPLLAAGFTVIAIGLAAVALAWYHAGNTNQVWVQNQELISGGIGGLCLVVLGVGLIVTDRLAANRAAEAERWQQLLEALRTPA